MLPWDFSLECVGTKDFSKKLSNCFLSKYLEKRFVICDRHDFRLFQNEFPSEIFHNFPTYFKMLQNKLAFTMSFKTNNYYIIFESTNFFLLQVWPHNRRKFVSGRIINHFLCLYHLYLKTVHVKSIINFIVKVASMGR